MNLNDEFSYANLGDERLNKRLKIIANQRISNPEASLSNCSDGSKAMKATYRFFSNAYFGKEDILKSHQLKTIERIKKEKIVLALQDTTSIDYTAFTKTKGLGVLETKKSKGVLVHTTLAVNLLKEPLGIISQDIWARKTREERKETRYNRNIPITDKESYRWIKSLIKTSEIDKTLEDVTLVNIGDRESDIFEYFYEAKKLNQKVLVRAHHNRKVKDNELKMIEYVSATPEKGIMELELPKTNERDSRIAKISIKFSEVELLANKGKYNYSQLEPIKLNLIIAKEESNVENPIKWILLTNLDVNNFEEACEKLNWYSIRWQIEVFHKVLKSGCKVEKKRLGNVENIKKYLTLDSIVAWKILYVTMIDRQNEKLSTEIFSKLEWEILYRFVKKTKEKPQTLPTIGEFKVYLAKLGGFLGRKNDGDPGIQVIWKGLSKFSTILETWQLLN